MIALSAAPADIRRIKTTQQNCGLHHDHVGSLWFVGWDESPVIYRHDGKDSVSWTLPKGTRPSPHGAFASAADGTVFIGGTGPVVYAVKGDTLDVLPEPTIEDSDRSPYSMAWTTGGLYVTFANSESRTELHRFAEEKWSLLPKRFKDIQELGTFAGDLVARELWAELVIVKEDGAKGTELIDRASSSSSKIVLGESHIIAYGGHSLVVHNADGTVKHKLATLKSSTMSHTGGDQFLFVDEGGAVFSLDASQDEPSLVPQPYKKVLKAVTGIEVDRTGHTWFRQMAAHKSYFTVAEPSGKLVTVKNK